MEPEWSRIGRALAGPSGILELMDDLGRAMSAPGDHIMLGGGNPAPIPAVQAVWRTRMRDLLDQEPEVFDRMLVNYDTPVGRPAFIESLAAYLRRHYGWPVTAANIAVTNGTQNAFFHLFNMLADGRRTVRLPLCPEYIGYADQGINGPIFEATRPLVEERGDHGFKYRIDFDRLRVGPETAALCVSRPTNPSGNTLTDGEVRRLSELAQQAGCPLVVDNAYGAPFPGILFEEVTPVWAPHIVYSLSLSKLGLPGTRTGVLVADKRIIRALCAANAIANLATGNIGQELVRPLLDGDGMDALCRDAIRPFYEERAVRARTCLEAALPANLPWRLHTCEGSMFLWLWCEDLPITSAELYERLKRRDVLVVPGHYFFFGLSEAAGDWRHRHECLRINYAMDPEMVRRGLEIIAEEVALAYDGR